MKPFFVRLGVVVWYLGLVAALVMGITDYVRPPADNFFIKFFAACFSAFLTLMVFWGVTYLLSGSFLTPPRAARSLS